MTEEISIEAITIYLEAHPLVAVLLAVLTIMFLGSLIRMLVRMALILALVLVLGLYWTHQEAAEDWDVQAEMVKRKAKRHTHGCIAHKKLNSLYTNPCYLCHAMHLFSFAKPILRYPKDLSKQKKTPDNSGVIFYCYKIHDISGYLTVY